MQLFQNELSIKTICPLQLAPFIIMAALTIIISEATTMRQFPENMCENVALRTSAAANAGGNLVIAPLSASAWLIGELFVALLLKKMKHWRTKQISGLLAVDQTSLFFYTIASILVPTLIACII